MITLAPFVRKNEKKTLSVRSTMRDRGFQINPFAWVISFCKNDDDSWHAFSFPRETNDDIKWFQVIKFVRGSAGYLVLQKQCHFRHAFSFPSETKHDIWWLEVIRLVTGPYQMWGFAQGGTLCLGPAWHEPCSERVFLWSNAKKIYAPLEMEKKFCFLLYTNWTCSTTKNPTTKSKSKTLHPRKSKSPHRGKRIFCLEENKWRLGEIDIISIARRWCFPKEGRHSWLGI